MRFFLTLDPHFLVYRNLRLLVVLLVLNLRTLFQLSLHGLSEDRVAHFLLYLVNHVIFAGGVLLVRGDNSWHVAPVSLTYFSHN